MAASKHRHSLRLSPQVRQTDANNEQSVQEMLKTCLEIIATDTALARASSAVVPMTGDLRPLWRVSGRVRNRCPNQFSDVTYLIHIYRKNTIEELDSTELIISGTIEPDSTRGFEQTVHLRINEPKWEWNLYPIKGKIGACRALNRRWLWLILVRVSGGHSGDGLAARDAQTAGRNQ